MIKTVSFDNSVISYELTRKNVKNINLRIKADGSVSVSANPFVPIDVIERFLLSKKDFILRAVSKVENKPPLTEYFSVEEIKEIILSICHKIYPYYEERGVNFPVVKFRFMTSCWGNCRSTKGILTFNTNLRYAPWECVEYVVYHEFTHFLQPNHSRKFYDELSLVCPDWKQRKALLKTIRL